MRHVLNLRKEIGEMAEKDWTLCTQQERQSGDMFYSDLIMAAISRKQSQNVSFRAILLTMKTGLLENTRASTYYTIGQRKGLGIAAGKEFS